MIKNLPLLFAAALTLSACGLGDSRLNPFNWFGGAEEEVIEAAPPVDGIEDPRGLVTALSDLTVDRAPGGAIVTAYALPQTQGYWDTALIAENDGRPVDGVLALQFRATPPFDAQPTGTDRSRQITAVIFLSNQDLEFVRTIEVKSQTNILRARR